MERDKLMRVAIFSSTAALLSIKSLLPLSVHDDDRWITIGSHENEYGEHTGRHVKIDEHGNIVGGSVPKSMQGKNIKSAFKRGATTVKSKFPGRVTNNHVFSKWENGNNRRLYVQNNSKSARSFGYYDLNNGMKWVGTGGMHEPDDVKQEMSELNEKYDFSQPKKQESHVKTENLNIEETKLPTLIGSEKQIAWAERIRSDKIQQLKKYAENGARNLKKISAISEKDLQPIIAQYGRETAMQNINKLKEKAQQAIYNYRNAAKETRASWWIDNR